jgi:hypothetical protein
MKQVLAIFLALLMLTTNVGITFATHYCGGKAVKTTLSLGQDDIDCGMADMDTPCENPSESPTVKRKNCCENKYTQVTIEGDYNTPAVVKTAVDFQFIAVFVVTYINLYSFNASTEAEYTGYSPPLLALDIPVLIQSFLI